MIESQLQLAWNQRFLLLPSSVYRKVSSDTCLGDSWESDTTRTLSTLVSGSIILSGQVSLHIWKHSHCWSPGPSHQKGTARCDLCSQAQKSEEGPEPSTSQVPTWPAIGLQKVGAKGKRATPSWTRCLPWWERPFSWRKGDDRGLMPMYLPLAAPPMTFRREVHNPWGLQFSHLKFGGLDDVMVVSAHLLFLNFIYTNLSLLLLLLVPLPQSWRTIQRAPRRSWIFLGMQRGAPYAYLYWIQLFKTCFWSVMHIMETRHILIS